MHASAEASARDGTGALAPGNAAARHELCCSGCDRACAMQNACNAPVIPRAAAPRHPEPSCCRSPIKGTTKPPGTASATPIGYTRFQIAACRLRALCFEASGGDENADHFGVTRPSLFWNVQICNGLLCMRAVSASCTKRQLGGCVAARGAAAHTQGWAAGACAVPCSATGLLVLLNSTPIQLLMDAALIARVQLAGSALDAHVMVGPWEPAP